MNEFEEDGPTLLDIAKAFAFISIIAVAAYMWGC